MRVLALDIGTRRIGVAISDPSGRVATPHSVIDADCLRGDFREIVALVSDSGSELVLLGMPRSLDGTLGPQAEQVHSAGERMAQFLPVPVVYADERLSSAQASRVAQELGVSTREQRGKLDAAAASIFLQAWLDARTENTSE